MREKFSMSTALMHFKNTEGPPGFLWKYFATYLLVMGLIYGVYMYVFMGTYIPFMEAALSGSDLSDSEMEALMMTRMLPMFGMMILFLPLFLVVLSVFESAALRRYVRKEGFSIGLGADEFRVMGVMLLWGLFGILAYFAIALITGLLILVITLAFGSDAIAPAVLVTVPMVIGGMIFFVYFGVRLSPASAVTIRDRKITFFSAMQASKGRFWPMLGAFLVMYIIAYIVQLVTMMIAGGSAVGVFATNPEILEAEDPTLVLEMLMSPAMLFPALIGLVGMVLMMGFIQLGYLGITARAAITDENWADLSTADTFS